MKQIEVKNKTYLFIEVPDDATDFYYDYHSVILYNSKSIFDEKGCKGGIYDLPKSKIISTTKDISEEQAESIVDEPLIEKPFRPLGNILTYPSEKVWNKYKYSQHFKKVVGVWMTDICGAKESLQSLIEANGLDINKNYLILLKTEQ